MKFKLLAAAILLIHTTHAWTATIIVLNTNDSGAGSLRNAVATSNAGDIIDMTALSGTISLTSGHIDIPSGKDITINGPGATILTIDCNSISRAFYIYDADVVINGLKIMRGMTTDNNGGGAIRAVFGSNLTVSYCQIENCETSESYNSRGGAIDVVSYDPDTWNENGAVTVNILFSQIENCRAYIGGGFRFVGWTQPYSINIENTTIKNNSTGAFGSLSSGNDGGGMEIIPKQDGNPTGGIVSITNSTFSGNSTGGPWNARSGGALSLGTGMYEINSCTIANNSTPTDGGGIAYWGGGNCTVTNTIIADNTAPTDPNVYGTYASGGFNLIGDNAVGNGFNAGTDLNSTNPSLSALANNGGFGETHAIGCASPAIDVGGNNPTLDQRVLPRVCDPDIGAFEYQTACNCVPLPVELVYFSATAESREVKLNWQTLSEINNDYFIVQRSQEGEIWDDILIKGGAGNSNELIEYMDYDSSPLPNTSYYRLLQFDFDGTLSTSEIVAVNFNENLDIYVNPTIYANNVQLLIKANHDWNALLHISDNMGRLVVQENIEIYRGSTNYPRFWQQLVRGTYYLTLTDLDSGMSYKQKLIVL